MEENLSLSWLKPKHAKLYPPFSCFPEYFSGDCRLEDNSVLRMYMGAFFNSSSGRLCILKVFSVLNFMDRGHHFSHGVKGLLQYGAFMPQFVFIQAHFSGIANQGTFSWFSHHFTLFPDEKRHCTVPLIWRASVCRHRSQPRSFCFESVYRSYRNR